MIGTKMELPCQRPEFYEERRFGDLSADEVSDIVLGIARAEDLTRHNECFPYYQLPKERMYDTFFAKFLVNANELKAFQLDHQEELDSILGKDGCIHVSQKSSVKPCHSLCNWIRHQRRTATKLNEERMEILRDCKVLPQINRKETETRKNSTTNATHVACETSQATVSTLPATTSRRTSARSSATSTRKATKSTLTLRTSRRASARSSATSTRKATKFTLTSRTSRRASTRPSATSTRKASVSVTPFIVPAKSASSSTTTVKSKVSGQTFAKGKFQNVIEYYQILNEETFVQNNSQKVIEYYQILNEELLNSRTP